MHRLTSILKKFLLFWGLFFIFCYSFQSCCAKTSNLKFAQVSDVHFSTIENDTNYKVLKASSLLLDDTINQINSTANIDFTVFTGDLINTPSQDELLKFTTHANLLTKPWYSVFGNHDVCVSGGLNKSRFLEIMCGHNKDFCYKTPYYSFTPKKGYKAIILDTTIDEQGTSNGKISEEQLDWLKQELKKSKGDIVLIYTHVPVVEPFPSENHRLLNSYDLKLLLKKFNNPIIICSGHYHASKITQEDNVLYISSPSLVTYPCAFRVVNILPKRNKVIVDVYIKDTRLKTIQDNAKAKCMASPLLSGKEEDRNWSYEIKR